jgi:3-isopropylmalate/(R)-2-methylmalate dehydratase small subunit
MTNQPHTTRTTRGRVRRLGADIDTDVLAPGAYMKHGIEVIAQHCLESVRPEFAAGVRPGDVIVAGPNFGIGSSREQAAGVLVHLGVSAVVAPSFSGLFFRNAFNLGLLLITCEPPHDVQDGETVSLTPADPPVLARAHGSPMVGAAVPSFLMDMVRAGGLLNVLRQRARSDS